MNSSSSANRTISSNLRVISFFVRPSMMPLMKTFSRPEISGWKPAPSSIRAEILPVDRDPAGGRLGDPGDELEEGALARAVLADEAERLALLDVEADVVDGRDELVRPERAEQVALDDGALERLEAVLGRVFLVDAGDVVEHDGGHQTSSGNESRRRSKTAYPITKKTSETRRVIPSLLPVEQRAVEEAVVVALDDVGHRVEAEDAS